MFQWNCKDIKYTGEEKEASSDWSGNRKVDLNSKNLFQLQYWDDIFFILHHKNVLKGFFADINLKRKVSKEH